MIVSCFHSAFMESRKIVRDFEINWWNQKETFNEKKINKFLVESTQIECWHDRNDFPSRTRRKLFFNSTNRWFFWWRIQFLLFDRGNKTTKKNFNVKLDDDFIWIENQTGKNVFARIIEPFFSFESSRDEKHVTFINRRSTSRVEWRNGRETVRFERSIKRSNSFDFEFRNISKRFETREKKEFFHLQ